MERDSVTITTAGVCMEAVLTWNDTVGSDGPLAQIPGSGVGVPLVVSQSGPCMTFNAKMFELLDDTCMALMIN